MKTFVALALHAGLRKGELFGLKWEDISPDELRVRKAKGRRFRIVPLNAIAEKALRTQPKHISSPYVFCGPKGKPWVDVRKSFNTALDNAEHSRPFRHRQLPGERAWHLRLPRSSGNGHASYQRRAG